MTRRDWKMIFIVLGIALLVRLVGINSFPPGLWMDEGLNGYDAYYTLHDGPRGEATGFQLVYPDIFPREPLLVWILSIAIYFGGPKVIVMRLVMVLFGALACAVTYRAVRFIEGSRGLALTAAIVLSTMHWHSHFSRLVFRTNLVPLIAISLTCRICWVAAAERKAGKKGWWRWLLVGMLAGVGFYTYLSWYFFIPVVCIWFWALRSDAPDENTKPAKSFKHSLLPFLAGALLIFSPLLIHYATSPGDLTARPQAVSPLNDGRFDAVKIMARNTLDVCLMFAVRGDHVQMHNVAERVNEDDPDFGKTGTPVFDPVWAAFFYLGVVLTLLAALRSKGRPRRIALAWMAWLFFMSLPSIVSQTDSANTLRNLGVTPAVAFFVARGWWWLFQKLKNWASRPGAEIKQYSWSMDKRKILVWCIVALFIWGALFQVYKAWERHPRLKGIDNAFNKNIVDIAGVCEYQSNSICFVPNSIYEHYTFAFLTLGREDLRPLELEAALTRNETYMVHRVLCLSPFHRYAYTALFPGFEFQQPFLLGTPQDLYPPDEVERVVDEILKKNKISEEDLRKILD